MEFQTTDEWDENLWRKAEMIYNQAFPAHGRKKQEIIRRMFERGLCQLHIGVDQSEVIAMALTGVNKEAHMLIIDYLAVLTNHRQKGYGRQFVEYLKTWAQKAHHCRGIIIEVEAEPTDENLQRIRFWENCGFHLTEYIHHYIWVPEPYQAMYLNFHNELPNDDNGKSLFQMITKFHKEAYRA